MTQPIESNPELVESIAPIDGSGNLWIRVGCVLAGVVFVVFFNLVGPLQLRTQKAVGGDQVAVDFSRILVDWTYAKTPDGEIINDRHPMSVQAFMWVAFFLGLGELWIRNRGVRSEEWLLKIGLLPEDERTMLTAEKLGPIYIRARQMPPDAILPTLLRRLVKEFRKSLSVDRVNTLLDSSLELMLHRLDLRYTALRYLVWAIPTLGFLGTVIGIADALSFAGSGALQPDQLLMPTTQKLGVAFYTTLLALLQSGGLMLGLNLVQASEEKVLNDAGEYCLENLVIRLVEPSQISKNT